MSNIRTEHMGVDPSDATVARHHAEYHLYKSRLTILVQTGLVFIKTGKAGPIWLQRTTGFSLKSNLTRFS